MKKFLLCGIDPGLSGAVAFYNFETKSLDSVFDIPTQVKKNGKREIDTFHLTQLIDMRASHVLLAVIEEVHAMPEQGVSSTFTFGYATGIVTGVIAGFNIPAIRTPAAVWKMVMGLTSDKNYSRKVAAQMFPTHAERFTRKKDDGRAEAAMLAHYGTRILPNSGERRKSK